METESRKGYAAESAGMVGSAGPLSAAPAGHYSVHLPLCGRPSRHIVVWKSRAPCGSRGILQPPYS